MNIVIIHSHDTGRFLQPYGCAVPTPHLQQFARQGTLFRNAFCASPTCSPSRAAMLTGQNAHSCGMLGLAHRGFSMPDYSRHLATYLRLFGYETVLCGIQHEAPQAEQLGYSRILDGPCFDMGQTDFDSVAFDTQNANLASAFVCERHDKPFFLSLGLFNTHRQWPAHSAAVAPEYLAPFPGMHNNRKNREDMANFIASVQICDDVFGTIRQALREAGLLENTLLVYTTDHGLALPGMKCTLHDSGTGVAFLLDYPGNPAKGACVDAMVSHLDVFPTICDLCSLPKPGWLEGKSLLPLLTGQQTALHESLFSEVNYHAAYEPVRGVRSQRYKYIRHFLPRGGAVLPNVDDCPEKEFLYKAGCYTRFFSHQSEELYDLYCDPGEMRNLAFDEAFHEQKHSMAQKLEDWMHATNDLLLSGDIPAPAGAFVNERGVWNAAGEPAPPISTHKE